MRVVFVVAGGVKEEGDFRSLLRAEGEETEGVVLIGADEGALWLVEHGFRPELAVGDFDTVGDEGIRRLLAAEFPSGPLPARRMRPIPTSP